MTAVVAFDPGPHVGVATWYGSIDSWGEAAHDPENIWLYAERWIQEHDVVVCEDFAILGSRDKNSNATIEMIGVLRYLAWKHRKPFITQRPADAKFSSNDKLKKLGWWKPASADHARSASRHLLLYLVNTRQIDASIFLEG